MSFPQFPRLAPELQLEVFSKAYVECGIHYVRLHCDKPAKAGNPQPRGAISVSVIQPKAGTTITKINEETRKCISASCRIGHVAGKGRDWRPLVPLPDLAADASPIACLAHEQAKKDMVALRANDLLYVVPTTHMGQFNIELVAPENVAHTFRGVKHVALRWEQRKPSLTCRFPRHPLHAIPALQNNPNFHNHADFAYCPVKLWTFLLMFPHLEKFFLVFPITQRLTVRPKKPEAGLKVGPRNWFVTAQMKDFTAVSAAQDLASFSDDKQTMVKLDQADHSRLTTSRQQKETWALRHALAKLQADDLMALEKRPERTEAEEVKQAWLKRLHIGVLVCDGYLLDTKQPPQLPKPRARRAPIASPL